MNTTRQQLNLQLPRQINSHSFLCWVLLFLLGIEVVLCKNVSCDKNSFLFSSCLNDPENERVVCGVNESDDNNPQHQLRLSFPTICQACQHNKISFYVKGACSMFPSEVIFCNPDQYGQNETCSLDYEPVCSFNENGHFCAGKSCGVDTINSCQACSYEGYSYYIPGTCSD